MKLLISASQVARIKEVSHQLLDSLPFFLTK
jgi:hypothetical protein